LFPKGFELMVILRSESLLAAKEQCGAADPNRKRPKKPEAGVVWLTTPAIGHSA
jgi:hypothetical protein